MTLPGVSRGRARSHRVGLLAAGMLLAAAASAPAEEPVSRDLVIRDHKFEPAEIHVPARTRIVLQVENRDDTAEEWESTELKIEKVIAGGRKTPVRLQPLEPGRYPFFGEYHSDTAQGVIVAE